MTTAPMLYPYHRDEYVAVAAVILILRHKSKMTVNEILLILQLAAKPDLCRRYIPEVAVEGFERAVKASCKLPKTFRHHLLLLRHLERIGALTLNADRSIYAGDNLAEVSCSYRQNVKIIEYAIIASNNFREAMVDQGMLDVFA